MHVFFISENQGKIHADWAPPGASCVVDQDIRELTEEDICELRERIIARRRGDSFPSKEFLELYYKALLTRGCYIGKKKRSLL